MVPLVKAMARIYLFLLCILAFFTWAGATVTRISGEGVGGSSGDVSAETGRTIFFGKGKCSTCHSIGAEGSAIRCPNLGVGGKFDASVGVRGATRVEGLTHIQYIVESIYNPNAYIVSGYPKGLMKPINKPPIALSDAEITSVVMYLLEASGVPVEDPAQILAAQKPFASGAISVEGEAVGNEMPDGDPDLGQSVFLDMECTRCHLLQGLDVELSEDEQGGVGPELTNIGSIQTRRYLLESLLEPNAVIVADPDGVEPGGEGSYRDEFGDSRMPSFLDTLTVQQLLDLATFLASQQPPEESNE